MTDLSLEAMVADLETVVDSLKLRRFSLIGLCQGGVIAVACAARHPQRVSRLVLYDSYLYGAFVDPADEKLARQAQVLSQMIEIGWGRKVGAFREVFANLLMPDGTTDHLKSISELQRRSAAPVTASQLWNAFNSFDIRRDAPKVTLPTLVFHVRGDAMVPFEAGRRLAAALPNARFQPLEGKNHILRDDEPAWLTIKKELNEFLDADEQMEKSVAKEFASLTAREREILECIRQGWRSTTIRYVIGSRSPSSSVTM